MAKKQTIVLLHGNKQLTANTANLIQGELAVYNASAATDVEIYATDENGNLATFQTAKKTNDAIDAVSTQASANKTNIATLSGNVATISGDVSTLQTKTATLEGKVGTLETTSSNHASRLESVEAIVGATSGEGTGASLVDRVETLESTIVSKASKADFEAYTAATNTTLGTLATKDELANAESALTATISGVSSNLSSLEDEVSALTQTVGTKVDKTSFNAYTAATNTTLGTLATKDELANAESALTTTISGVSGNLSSLEKVVEDLSDVVATKLAITTFETYTADTKTAIDSKATKAELNSVTADTASKFGAVQDQIGALNTAVGELETEVPKKLDKGTFNTWSAATETAISGKVEQTIYDLKVAELSREDARLDGEIKKNASAITEHNTSITALQTSATTLSNNKLDTTVYASYTAATETTLAAAKTVVSGPTTGKVTVKSEQDPTTGAYTYTIETDNDIASASELQGVKTIATKLQGDDADKTAREIAASEVAKVVASAPQDLDTLKEIADYIASDKTQAAAINTSISNLNAALSGYTEKDAVSNKFAAVDKAIADEKNAREAADTTFSKVLSGYTTDNSVKTAVDAAKAAGDNAQTTANSALSLAQENASTLAGHGTNIATLQSQITAKTETSAFEAYKESNNSAVAAAKTEVETKTAGFVRVSHKTGTNGQSIYTVSENDIASATELAGVKATADKAVQKITYKDAAGTTISLTGTTIDLSGIVIDGGTY